MSEFVPVVTNQMLAAAYDLADSIPPDDYGRFKQPKPGEYLAVMVAQPDFQRQLRAYVAEQMRGLVADEADDDAYSFDRANQHGHNACRAETLANIERWEKDNEGQ